MINQERRDRAMRPYYRKKANTDAVASLVASMALALFLGGMMGAVITLWWVS